MGLERGQQGPRLDRRTHHAHRSDSLHRRGTCLHGWTVDGCRGHVLHGLHTVGPHCGGGTRRRRMQTPTWCKPARPEPAITFHGTSDPFIPFLGAAHRVMSPNGKPAPLPGIAADGTVIGTKDKLSMFSDDPIPVIVQNWATRNGCKTTPKDTSVASDVILHTYPCPVGAGVEFLRNHGRRTHLARRHVGRHAGGHDRKDNAIDQGRRSDVEVLPGAPTARGVLVAVGQASSSRARSAAESASTQPRSRRYAATPP